MDFLTAAEKTLKLFFPELQKKDDATSNPVVDVRFLKCVLVPL